jgi:monothiol glutaredoxin
MVDEKILTGIKKDIADNAIVLFVKGTKEEPRCGFSARAIAVFKEIGKPFKVVDVLPDPRIRETLSSHSQWPTIPQVYINGEFVGGSDIVMEMFEAGELQTLVEKAFAGKS